MIFVLLSFFIIVNLISIAMVINYFSSLPKITGGSTTGTIRLTIEEWRNMEIVDPQNITYNYSVADGNYTFFINTSTNFEVETWWYTLFDLFHNTSVNSSVVFTPNDTFQAVRWSNELRVYVNTSSGNEYNQNVTFFVAVPNSAPVIEFINTSIFVCENDYISYYFNATDIDEDSLSSDISPKNPFYVTTPTTINATLKRSEIFSGTLGKGNVRNADENWRLYEETVSVDDGEYSDSVQTNITAIEINNIPIIGTIGVQTIYYRGENSSFEKQLNITDTESGTDISNFSYNLSFISGTQFFDINQSGLMNFTANYSLVGVHNISVCVVDWALENPHSNIDICGQDGSNQTACQNFSITITEENRPPTITDYYNLDLNLTVEEGEEIYFNVTMYDPDLTPLDTYWFLNDFLEEFDFGVDQGGVFAEFNYTFNYSSEGNHTLIVKVTDGILNESYDYVEWEITVLDAEPPGEPPVTPPPSGGGGGGGGGGRAICEPTWGCEDWGICKQIEIALEEGTLLGEDYRSVKANCTSKGWKDDICGFQMKICADVNDCGSEKGKPLLFQVCYYTEKPDCFDGIKNCHHDLCEVLVDCGGPCDACASCSDDIQNQGEEGIDCGGPCSECYKSPSLPLFKKSYLKYLVIIVLIAILIIVVISVIRLFKIKDLIKGYEKEQY